MLSRLAVGYARFYLSWLLMGGLLLAGLPALAQCGYSVNVTPAGPLSLPNNGGHTLVATATYAAFNRGGTGCNAGSINEVKVQADGKLLVAGVFQEWNRDPQTPHGIIRLHPDGQRDVTFNVGGTGTGGGVNSGMVSTILVQPDGKIVLGGSFTTYNGVAVPRGLIRLLADGRLDPSFNPGGLGTGGTVTNNVATVALQADGKLVIGGSFTTYNGLSWANDHVLRVNADGTLDPSFNNSFGATGITGGWVSAVVVQPDGNILVGGRFSDYNGFSTSPGGYQTYCLLRLLPNGRLDPSFNSGNRFTSGFNAFDSSVDGLTLQPNGYILVAGELSVYNSQPVPHGLVRLTPTGALDPSFNPGGTGFNTGGFRLRRVLIQPDGRLVVAGDFSSYNGNAAVSDYVLRLYGDGTLDPSFNAGGRGFNDYVWTVALQADGKVLVGGNFNFYNTTYVPGYLIRLNTDGRLNDSDQAVSNASYQWSTGATTPSIITTQPGTYSVAVSVGGCTLASAPVLIMGGTALGTPSERSLSTSVSIYPNPSHGTVTVGLLAPSKLASVTFTLYNSQGQCVRRYAPQTGSMTNFQTDLDIHGLAAGVYSLRITGQDLHISRVLVVE